MTKEEFTCLFEAIIEQAAREVEHYSHVTVTRQYDVELHGAYHRGDIMTVQETADALFISKELFWRDILVLIKGTGTPITHLYVVASGHPPGPFEVTRNIPPGTGPFHTGHMPIDYENRGE